MYAKKVIKYSTKILYVNSSVCLVLNFQIKYFKAFNAKNQSHYIEVVQGSVSGRAIHNRFWIFSLFFAPKKFKQNFKKDIRYLFSADATVFSFQMFFCPWKHKKPLSKVAHNRQFFFQNCQLAQNQSKSHILFIFCSIQMAPCTTSI